MHVANTGLPWHQDLSFLGDEIVRSVRGIGRRAWQSTDRSRLRHRDVHRDGLV